MADQTNGLKILVDLVMSQISSPHISGALLSAGNTVTGNSVEDPGAKSYTVSHTVAIKVVPYPKHTIGK